MHVYSKIHLYSEIHLYSKTRLYLKIDMYVKTYFSINRRSFYANYCLHAYVIMLICRVTTQARQCRMKQYKRVSSSIPPVSPLPPTLPLPHGPSHSFHSGPPTIPHAGPVDKTASTLFSDERVIRLPAI